MVKSKDTYVICNGCGKRIRVIWPGGKCWKCYHNHVPCRIGKDDRFPWER